MVGYNYDMNKSKKMTADEREATRALGGIAILGGLGYLWLTRQEVPKAPGIVKMYSAGAFQLRGASSTVTSVVDVNGDADQQLVGYATNEAINIFSVHSGSNALTAVVKAEFQDGSTRSVSKTESTRASEGEGIVRSSFDIDPNIDFQKEIIEDGNSISQYTVTLNVSGKGQTKSIRFIVGA